MRTRRVGAALGALMLALAAGCATVASAETLVVISDVHLDPYPGADGTALLAAAPQNWAALYTATPPADYGSDANQALFAATLEDAAARVPSPDLVVFPGDFVTHGLADKTAAAIPGAGAAQVATMAAKTTLYVADRLAAAYPGVPVLPVLGNTDAACGDYMIEPGGAYLAAVWPAVERLVGADRLAGDAEKTWRAGGYYRAAHPTVAHVEVVALNNIFWSARYENRCGEAGADPGGDMLDWLTRTLEETEAQGRTVWLLYHIPSGVNSYGTAHAADACPATPVMNMAPRFAEAFGALLERYGARMTAMFSGHLHRDTFRLVPAGDGVAVDTIAPSVSPVFGNNPAYQAFDYDLATGTLTDKVTYAAQNLGEAAKGGAALRFDQEYRFTTGYGAAAYDAAALARIAAALSAPRQSAARTLYARAYGAGHGDDPADDWPVYGCAPGNVTAAAFEACRCP